MTESANRQGKALRDALERLWDEEAHDRGLIVERLSWTPERLAAQRRAQASPLKLRVRREVPDERDHDRTKRLGQDAGQRAGA